MKGCNPGKLTKFIVVKKNNRFYRVFYADIVEVKRVQKKRLPKVPNFFESEPMPEETSFEPFSFAAS